MKIKSLSQVDSFSLLKKVKNEKFSSLFKLAEENDLLILKFLNKKIYIPSSANVLNELYREDQKKMVKTPRAQHYTQAAIGKGLISTDNEEWVKERNKVKGLFSVSHTASLIHKIESVVNTCIGFNYGTNEIKSFFNHITIQVIGTLFFGHFSDKDGKLIVSSIDKMIEPTFERIVNPFYFLKAPIDRNIKRGRKTFLSTLEKCIEQARMENGDNLVKKYFPEGNHVESVGNLFAAGYETVSNALTWMFFELGRNKSISEKLKEEILNINSNVSYDELLIQIPYTQACFKEALRLYPPLWLNGRMANKNIDLQGYIISAKSDILISPFLFHHLSKYWESPEIYNPEREYDTNKGTYIPFGKGPRACIGERMALLEAYLVIICLYKKFDLEIISNTIKPKFHFTLRPQGEIHLNIKPKSK